MCLYIKSGSALKIAEEPIVCRKLIREGEDRSFL